MGKTITMKDIAKQLGVSTVTVSKALSDREGVSSNVREMIKLKATEMGYRYNSMGKSMKEGVNYNIGILVAERFMHDNAFYSKMYQAMNKDLMLLNYFALLEVVSEASEEGCVLPLVLQNNKVDGIVLLGQMSRNYIENIEATGIPYIFLDFSDDHFQVDTIVSDSFYGAFELTNYLISLGHKKIGFVGNRNATTSIMDRYIGYYKAMLLQQLTYEEDWIIKDRDDSGKFCNFVLPSNMPTAFVCNCDEIAYSFIKKLKRSGYRVPEDISVVGYDNHIYAAISIPAITTVEVNVEAMSEAAVNSIVKRIKRQTNDYGRKIISGRIILRDSAVAPGMI